MGIAPFNLIASGQGISALGFNFGTFIVQLITFIFIFLLIKRFAAKPLIALLEKRRKTIEEGVRLGEELNQERAKLQAEVEKVMRDARHEADQIISTGQKEAREILRDAEKAARQRSDSLMADAEHRIAEEAKRAKRSLEKEVVGMVSDATEAIVEEKVDQKKDAVLIDKALRDREK